MPNKNVETEARDGIVYFMDGVGTSDTVYTYPNPQSEFTLQNTGTRRLIWSVGPYSDILVNPGETVTRQMDINTSSFTLRAEYHYQSFTMSSREVSVTVPTLTGLNEQLAENAEVVMSITSFGADSTGSINSQDALNSAINALPSSGGKIRFPAGTFHIDSITTSKPIIFEGAGKDKTIIIRKKDAGFGLFILNGATNSFGFRDLTIDGKNFPGAGIRAIGIDSLFVDNISIRNCGVVGNLGSPDGIYAYSVKNLYAHNSHFYDNERHGIHGTPVINMVVSNCRFINNGSLGVANEQNTLSPPVSPVFAKYIGNYVENCGAGGLHGEADINGPEVFEMIVIGNTIKDCGRLVNSTGGGWGIVVGNNSKGMVIGNTVSGFAKNATGSTYRDGIVIGGIKGKVTVSNNQVYDSGQSGIRLDGNNQQPVIISNNHIFNNGAYGISGYNSPNLSINSNHVESNKFDGILLNMCSTSRIADNKIINNSAIGAGQYSGLATKFCFDIVAVDNEINGSNQQYGYNLDNAAYVDSLTFLNNKVKTVHTLSVNFVDTFVTDVQISRGEKQLKAPTTPTFGYWEKGTQISNVNPAASGFMGWVCTTAGTANKTNWASNTAYTVGQQVNTGGNVYQCITAGTSGSAAPTGTGTSIADGTVVWKYVGALAVFKTFGAISA